MPDLGILFEVYELLLSEFRPLAVSLVVFAFIYASLGRNALFHFQWRPRLVLSVVLSMYASSLIMAENWDRIILVTAISVSIGLIGVILYNVGFQQGQTKEQATEIVIEDEEDNPV